MARRTQEVTMEGISLAIRNFSGSEKPFNPKGKRNFLAMLDEETAQAMIADGWNVKYLPPREGEDEPPRPFLKVNVNYDNEPIPKVILVTSRGQNPLDADTIGMLDGAVITNADLLVTPFHYEMNGKTGVSAYLKKGYFTIEEDALDLKYGATLDTRSPGDEIPVTYTESPF